MKLSIVEILALGAGLAVPLSCVSWDSNFYLANNFNRLVFPNEADISRIRAESHAMIVAAVEKKREFSEMLPCEHIQLCLVAKKKHSGYWINGIFQYCFLCDEYKKDLARFQALMWASMGRCPARMENERSLMLYQVEGGIDSVRPETRWIPRRLSARCTEEDNIRLARESVPRLHTPVSRR